MTVGFWKGQSSTSSSPVDSDAICDTKPCIELSANILSSLSDTIDPCDDFFEYACQNWIKAYPMPKGKSTWGTLFKRGERTSHEVRQILEAPIDTNVPFSGQLKRIYEACMDMDEINARGATPAIDYINTNFGGWSWDRQSPAPYPELVKTGQMLGVQPFFGFGVGTDLQDSTRHVLSFDQDGLSFMNRDYYINKTSNTPIDFEACADCDLKHYHDYMVEVIKRLAPGREEASIRVDTANILKFEQKLAAIMLTIEAQRDFSKTYHDMTVGALRNLSRFDVDFDWLPFLNDFFTEVEITNEERIAMYAKDYFEKLPAVVQKEEGTIVHNYVTWLCTKQLIYTLSKEFQRLRYDLLFKVQGVDISCDERWRTCTNYARDNLPLIVGRHYVEQYFNNETKDRVTKFADNIKRSFVSILNEQKWMDVETKGRALEKAKKMTDKYGFPDYILNNTKINVEYDGLELESGDYWSYTQEMLSWAIAKHLSKLRKPVDKELWSMGIEETNAYYAPTDNAMVFPAGILQPPLYHPEYPSGFNYGAIGMIIGHEITHGFDDQGRHMGANGNMENWWGAETERNFATRSQCMEEQYGSLEFAGMKLNGKLTLGENIADNGGIKIAYNAWKASTDAEVKLPGLSNYTVEQTFFLAQAQTWCSVTLEKAAINQMRIDAHPPNKLRVNQGLRNFAPFAEVWQCPSGSAMNPTDRCELW